MHVLANNVTLPQEDRKFLKTVLSFYRFPVMSMLFGPGGKLFARAHVNDDTLLADDPPSFYAEFLVGAEQKFRKLQLRRRNARKNGALPSSDS